MNVLHVFVYIRYVSRKLVYVFIYFFVCGFSSHHRIFFYIHSYGYVTITSEGLQILIYAQTLIAIEQWGFL